MSANSKKKRELLEARLEIVARKKKDPLKYAKQHKKQIAATKAPQSLRALFWGNRVGKTEWGAMETNRFIQGNHPYRDVHTPVEIWSVCPSFDAQEETTQPKILRYLPDHLIAHRDYLRGRILKKLTLIDGSFITFKSYEQGREKFQGAGKRLIWFDEEPPKDIWEECFVRVEAGVPLDIIMTMTPIKGMTWVYDQIYLDTANQDVFVSTAGWDDNPWLTEEQKERMSRGLTAAALKVRKEGQFTKRVGLVCSWWNRSSHLRHYEKIDQSWTWFEILDGGFSDPACWLLIGVDGDDNVHVVDGFSLKGLQASAIKNQRDTKTSGITITRGWIDNDDPRLRKDLEDLGMVLEPVKKLPGESKSWDETMANKLAEYGEIQKGSGQPRLFISDTLVQTNPDTGEEENWFVQQIENLSWIERSPRGESEILPHWDAHRKFGHHFDAVYALSYFLVEYKREDDEELDDLGGAQNLEAWAIGDG